MSDPVKTVTRDGEQRVEIPLSEYRALLDAADEDAVDAAILRRILDDPDQDWVPADVVRRLASGENAVRVWREHRGLKACDLAAAAGIGRSYLSAIETGRKPGSVKALQGIAQALGLTIDDLVEPACTGGADAAQ